MVKILFGTDDEIVQSILPVLEQYEHGHPSSARQFIDSTLLPFVFESSILALTA